MSCLTIKFLNFRTLENFASRSSLIWVCTVCPDMSVRKLRIIQYLAVNYKKLRLDNPCPKKTCLWGFRPGSTKTRPHKMTRSLNFEVKRLYYLCSKNKGADQMCYYSAADLHLCFHICNYAGFLMAQLT